jgi:hypothetical protein
VDQQGAQARLAKGSRIKMWSHPRRPAAKVSTDVVTSGRSAARSRRNVVTCHSAWGPNADRRTNSLNCPSKEGSTSEADSQFRAIWGAEPGRLVYLNRPSFFGEILCCWRPRWIPGTKKSPMHAYAWYVWRKEPRSGPSLKVRVGKSETITALSAVNPPTRG